MVPPLSASQQGVGVAANPAVEWDAEEAAFLRTAHLARRPSLLR